MVSIIFSNRLPFKSLDTYNITNFKVQTDHDWRFAISNTQDNFSNQIRICERNNTKRQLSSGSELL